MRKLLITYFMLAPIWLWAQSNNHWTHNFNEESSLLSGAVVGGGAGPSAIFYNPASISEINESKLSINASLLSFEGLNAYHAYGEGIDLNDTRAFVVPRFFSYILKPPNNPKLNLEIAFLNRSNYQVENVTSEDRLEDVLGQLPGEERYVAFSKYENRHRDDWLGIGGSYKFGEHFSLGSSMFISAKTNYYFYQLDIEAGPTTQTIIREKIPFFTAKYIQQDFVKFNDYRLLWKVGLLFKKEHYSLGLNITTPSIGGIYSDGKRMMRKRSQSNITNPANGEPLPNYLLTDYAEKKEMRVNAKSPFSIAAGFTWYNQERTRTVYTTVEYFTGLDPYRKVEVDESESIADGTIFRLEDYTEWLTFIDGSKPVANLAVGYRWILRKSFMVLAGFRTDFNYKKKFDFSPFTQDKTFKSFDLDQYHFTGGMTVTILGQDLIAGLQYTFGNEKDQLQFANLSDPVEYNPRDMTALQGTRQNTMKSVRNSLSLYLGININLGEK